MTSASARATFARGRRLLLVMVHLAQLVEERAHGDLKRFGGARTVSTRGLKRLAHEIVLVALHALAKIARPAASGAIHVCGSFCSGRSRGSGGRGLDDHAAANALRKVARVDAIASCEDDRSLEEVPELAHVSRKRIAREQLARERCEIDDGASVARVRLAHKVAGELWQVFRARAERRYGRRKPVEAKEQILPERPFLDHALEVLVRCADDANVNRDVALGADTLNRARLEHTEQRDLRAHRELADLVEEHRAAVRLLEDALVCTSSASERALFVPEQRALHERLGDRSTVDGAELAGESALHVNVPRNDVFSGTRLAVQKHRELRRRDTGEVREQRAHRRALRGDHTRLRANALG